MSKKIMLLNFPLLDVGGITTWAHQIIKGFQKLGCQADHYYCTPTGRIKASENSFTPIGKKYQRGEKIPSKSIGYGSDEDRRYFIKLMYNYDYVIFVHPSPHPTTANLNNKKVLNWRMLYKVCDLPKVVVFHDMNWHKTNKWFADVREHIDVVLCDQHNFIDSVRHYVGNNKSIVTDWLFFPFDMDGIQYIHPKEKENVLCMLPQWIKWKNHHKLFEQIHDIRYPINFYNGGIQYHNICKTESWHRNIKFDYVENKEVSNNGLHNYYGFVTYSKAKEAYKKSVGSIDLTTRTYQNFTHHESCLHGAAILCTEDCRKGPYNHIHDGEYWPIDMKNIGNSINRFCELSADSKYNISYPASLRTRENFECSKVAAKINSIVDSLNI